MPLRTFSDLKKHLSTVDDQAMVRQLAAWLDHSARSAPAELVSLHLEWDLVAGEESDEIVGDLYGYKAPGLDPEVPSDWDWHSDPLEHFLFLGIGAAWSEAVEVLTDDEVSDAEEAITSFLDAVVKGAVAASRELVSRRSAGDGLTFFWSRRGERPRQYT